MLGLFTVLIALVSLLLMGVILIQNPKGGGLDSTFGGTAGANQVLGAAKSSDFIEKLTWGLAAALFILCLVTSVVVKTGGSGDGGTEPGSKADDTGYIHELPTEAEDAETFYI